MSEPSKTEIKRIIDQLRRAYQGVAWHGPSLLEVLSGVSAALAEARPLTAAHSIWEITRHIEVWEAVARRRIEGESNVELSAEEDWPPITDKSEESWQRTLSDLERGNIALRKAVERLNDRDLETTVAGAEYDFYFLLHGVIQHDLYHAGQIALLKRSVGPSE